VAHLVNELLLLIGQLAPDEGEFLPLLHEARLVEAIIVEAVLAVLQAVDGLLELLHFVLRLLPLPPHPSALCANATPPQRGEDEIMAESCVMEGMRYPFPSIGRALERAREPSARGEGGPACA
jgi:hypothetical protein